MFRASSRLSSGAQQLQLQPLVLPSESGDSSAVGCGRAGRPARPRPTALLSPRSKGQTRGCNCSCWTPDDGRENARNMLSCKQTSSNKLEKLLHLVGWFIWIVWWCTDLQTLNLYRLYSYYFNILTSRCFVLTINMQAVPNTDMRDVSLKDSVIYLKKTSFQLIK